MDFAGEFQQYATSTIRTSGGSGVRRSWASLARTFLSDPSAPKTHEKMAFTVAPSISRRPIASAGGPLALLNLLRDGKICLETSTCRLTPLHPWLTIIYVSPDWGQGAICRSRSYQIVFLPRIGWKAGLSQLLSHQSKRYLCHRPTYSAHPLRWGVVPSLQSYSARPRYGAVWKEGHSANLDNGKLCTGWCVLIFWYLLGTNENL